MKIFPAVGTFLIRNIFCSAHYSEKKYVEYLFGGRIESPLSYNFNAASCYEIKNSNTLREAATYAVRDR